MENTRASSKMVNPHFFQPLLPGFHNHLKIPTTFFLEHIEGKTTNENNAVVKLRSDASDLTWEVKMDGQKLTQGWEKLAISHNLRVGDIVIFRLDGALSFHVTCFGPSCCEIQYDDDDDDVIQISSDSEEIHNKTKAGSSSDHSSFVAPVTSSNLSRDTLFLPRDFTKSNGLMKRECEIILLNEDGKKWKLFLTYHKSNGRVYIRTGWRRFCKANMKRVNDKLTFKLVKRGTTPVLQLCSSVQNRKRLRASPSSSSSTSQCRFLTLTLTPSIFKKYCLCLPAPFVRANGIKNASKITLVDRYSIKRTTSLKPANAYGTMRVGKEWKEFCKVNGVKIGESFKLELIKEKENTATHLLKFCSKVS